MQHVNFTTSVITNIYKQLKDYNFNTHLLSSKLILKICIEIVSLESEKILIQKTISIFFYTAIKAIHIELKFCAKLILTSN